MVNKYYGEIFKILCEAREFKMSDIIKHSGLPKSSLSKFINGQSSLTIEQLDNALEAIQVDLSEYDYCLNHFHHNYREELFQKIDEANIKEDKLSLQEIYNEAKKYHEQMIALSAKAHLTGLTEVEVIEIGSVLMGKEILTFNELSILVHTIKYFSSIMIKSIIQDFEKHQSQFQNRFRYRRMMSRIACTGVITCINENKQKEAKQVLDFAQKTCQEKDSYAHLIYKFSEGFYLLYYGVLEEHKRGIEQMKKVITILEWEGSHELATYYEKLYLQLVKIEALPSWIEVNL